VHKKVVSSVACAVHHRTTGGGGVGPGTATCSRTARVLESHLDRFRTSMALNSGRVSAQLLGDISIWRHVLYGVHVK